MTLAEQYTDLKWKEQMQRELNHRVAQALVNAAEPGYYRTAVLSAVNGRWDDVVKDIQRRRITVEQAKSIVDDLLQARLISPQLSAWRQEEIDGLID